MHVYCGSCSPYKIDAFYVNEAWAVFVFRRYISILITRALGNTINSFYFIILVCWTVINSIQWFNKINSFQNFRMFSNIRP